MTYSLHPPTASVILSVAPSLSEPPGTIVNLSAIASGGSGVYEYNFLINIGGTWTETGYSASDTYAWDTTSLPAAFYDIFVYVRNAGSNEGQQAFDNLTYSLN